VQTPVRGQAPDHDWTQVARGVWAPPTPTLDPSGELRAWSLVLPSASAFTHLTAAGLYGWWLPSCPPHPVFVAMRRCDPRPRRPGLLVCRHPKSFAFTLRDGLRVTTPAETILAAARDLGVLDLVVLGDSALRSGHVTRTELEICAGQRRRGAPLLRAVIPLLDKRSESAWESIMRVLQVAAEIPVEPQHPVHDEDGRFLARADFWVVGTRRLHEYDGGVHRDPEVQDSDLRRDRALLRADWERYGFTSRHLLNEAASFIRDADQLLGRSWDAARLRAWEDLLNASMLRRPGRSRALHHWRRALDEPESGHPKCLRRSLEDWE
jgi:very-short-patch-repair endonuclease